MISYFLKLKGYKYTDQDNFDEKIAWRIIGIISVLSLLFNTPLFLAGILNNPTYLFNPIRYALAYFSLIAAVFCFFKIFKRNKFKVLRAEVILFNLLLFYLSIMIILLNIGISFYVLSKYIRATIPTISSINLIWESLNYDFINNFWYFYLPLFLITILTALFVILNKKSQASFAEPSKNFGAARWANKQDLEELNAYNKDNGIIIGVDNNGKNIYLPLCNKLIIAPSGKGKTVSSSIPLLLSHDGPMFVFDVKAELWAVTARYRSQVLKRKVVTIDPFGITRTPAFAEGKPEELLKEYHINPFDWIPEDRKERDRMINSFASSLVVEEGTHANHFDENAKILIRGYVDYLMHQKPSERNLAMLYNLMSDGFEDESIVFDEMSKLEGRAGAAANQINRVGSDERGSILSTSYRQIDWIGDSNIQRTLSESNFDLREFLQGNMDIFVVLPLDQVAQHNRLVRMLLSLIMSMVVRANPQELPKKKIVALLEELAQLGCAEDVEQLIETMRVYGILLWAVFQTLSQIKIYKKADLFLTMPLIQVFTNSDKETKEWIQGLGCDKTIITKSFSTNKGDSRQNSQVFKTTTSSGEGESYQETGTKLIQLDEISGMPIDEEFVFYDDKHPIRCKKVKYFENGDFIGKFDRNPLENR